MYFSTEEIREWNFSWTPITISNRGETVLQEVHKEAIYGSWLLSKLCNINKSIHYCEGEEVSSWLNVNERIVKPKYNHQNPFMLLTTVIIYIFSE